MNRLYKLNLLVIALAGLIYSCNTDDLDTTAPIISVDSPAEDAEYYLGDTIIFTCTFSDDVELGSYKIDIHYNTDGHSHEKSTLYAMEETPFSYSNSWEFDPSLKESKVEHSEIILPDSINGQPVAHGAYHFGVYCSDAAGNENSIFIDFHIEE